MKSIDNIPRPHYLNKILPYVNSGLIKILSGQRRVGKSYILQSVARHIRQSEPDANYIFINLEDFAFAQIKDAATLDNEIRGRLSEEKMNYIFIDEIQEVEGFDKVLRSLNLDHRNDIYVTGSNSAMLSSEMASRLAGRSIDIRIHPLSYSEFLIFQSLEDTDDAIDTFLRYGGMPYLRNLPNKNTWSEYLNNVTEALVYRDIVSRHSIRNNVFLQRMMMFLADNIGSLFTAKRITDFLKSQRTGGTVVAVQTYSDYICEAYLINRVMRWDIEGKRLFEIGEKYYFEDLGIRNSIIGYRPIDIGGLLENAVYNKLIFDGYDVKVGVLPKGREIDFIAEKGGERRYVQVAVNVNDPVTAEREFGNFAAIPDNYEKIVVTHRDSAPNTYNGIRMMSLRQFLTAE